jgi:large subunit ribosomal protein L9
MKVVFIQDVQGLAQIGEVKEVANGYGRNYLLPKKLALLATPGAMRQAEVQRKVESARQSRIDAEMTELAKRLEGTGITIKVKAGAEGKLFGSVNSADIAQGLLQVANVEVDRRKIDLEEPIKQVGNYEVVVRLTKTVATRIKVTVEQEQV